MRKIKRQTKSALNLPSLTLEGALFLPDQLEKAALGQAKHQSETDYQTPKGLRLKDDYSRAFQIACAQWKHFAPSLERADVDALKVTQTFAEEFLRDALGYSTLKPIAQLQINDRAYPITFMAGHLPVVVAPFTSKLDDSLSIFAIEGSGSRKKSAFQLAQELLNASDAHLWALVTNGKQLRLLRDAASLTRPSFLEIDLQDVLQGQRFSEFANIWRLLHASRAALNDKPEHCIWEAWRETGKAEGTRVRDGLRSGVEQALLVLGEGFIQHPANNELRLQLDNGELSKDAYFQQLLRLIYRLIFLFTVEERGVLHPADDSKTAQMARRAYLQGYALGRLREACLKRRNLNRFDDHWQALRIVFKGLADGEPRLALPALGGLFNPSQCQSIDRASLSNKYLLLAMRHLRWTDQNGTPAPVDYRNMGPEELGSVYESLLELVPEINVAAKTFGFIGMTSEGSTAGNARKTSGSYYTPDSLVQELIKSALEPVIADRLAQNKTNPTEALLNIRVIDPACGSGHFLLAAARRLAQELAILRSEDGAVKPADYRHALREVVSHCIFGVDRNPMALELARTALWLEGYEEGQPLSFLDHHLQCGDALLGLTNLKALEFGIPKAAFKPLSGDEKPICTELNKINTAALKQLEKDRKSPQFKLPLEQSNLLAELEAIEAMPQNSTREIALQEMAYQEFLDKAKNSRLRYAADMVLGAFLLPKTEETESFIPTTASMYLELVSESHNAQHIAQREAALNACTEARVFHWPLAFPQVFAQGGFDCVLGNPPWERIKLQEEEFFATRNADVAKAKNKAERAQRIQWLSEGMLAKHLLPELHHPEHECQAEVRLFNEFVSAKRTAEAASAFMHVNGDEGGRYALTGVGDVNTYALFAETINHLIGQRGRAGYIVPTGIATDDSTSAFFKELTSKNLLVSLYDFENRSHIFSALHTKTKFCLLTISGSPVATTSLCFMATSINDLNDERKVFEMSSEQLSTFNPNSNTATVFRARNDAAISLKIYDRSNILAPKQACSEDLWGASFMRMFDMSNDSHLFKNESGENLASLYEAKMFWHFDHRWALFDEQTSRLALDGEKRKGNFVVRPRYWVSKGEVSERLSSKSWEKDWLLAFRNVSDSRNERTFVSTILPRTAIGHSASVMFTAVRDASLTCCLLANLNSLTLDFIARQKIPGMNISYFMVEQLPVLSPGQYSSGDIEFIRNRVLELTYTADDLAGWALDLDYHEPPFIYNSERRAILRAELDAYYAHLYGLSRDDLRYILEPADTMGDDYPSETFRVLKNNELSEFGEYRTQRLVLEAWDKLERGELH